MAEMAEPLIKKKRFTMMRNGEEDILYVTGNPDETFAGNVVESNGADRECEATNPETNSCNSGESISNNSEANELFEMYSPSHPNEIRKKGQRGRPKKMNESMEWSDDASEALIELWQSKEELYNRQHPYFYVKEAKEKAIESIRQSLEKMGFKISVNQIFSKFQSLRTYFCSQRTKIATARKNGIYYDEESKWRFYKRLQFLDDNMKQRESYSNRKYYETPFMYEQNSFPRSMVVNENTERKYLHDYTDEKELRNQPVKIKMEEGVYKDEDQSFGDLVTSMVRQIKPGQDKDLLKLEVQQLIIKAKYANPLHLHE